MVDIAAIEREQKAYFQLQITNELPIAYLRRTTYCADSWPGNCLVFGEKLETI
jgi:hypothetical protein